MSEHQEQKALFQWAEIAKIQRPELALLFAIPNGGLRNRVVAAKLKAEGVKRGVPDLFLPVARKPWHGLFIEMKTKTGRPTKEQIEWMAALGMQLYKCRVCRGWETAAQVIEDYLGDGR